MPTAVRIAKEAAVRSVLVLNMTVSFSFDWAVLIAVHEPTLGGGN
jgi:hypothetical protein